MEIEGPELPRQPLAGLMTLTEKLTPKSTEPVAVASPGLIEKGRLAFTSLGCAACHQHGDGDQKLAWSGKAPQFAAMKNIGGLSGGET